MKNKKVVYPLGYTTFFRLKWKCSAAAEHIFHQSELFRGIYAHNLTAQGQGAYIYR